jgi:hypothetical protein
MKMASGSLRVRVRNRTNRSENSEFVKGAHLALLFERGEGEYVKRSMVLGITPEKITVILSAVG